MNQENDALQERMTRERMGRRGRMARERMTRGGGGASPRLPCGGRRASLALALALLLPAAAALLPATAARAQVDYTGDYTNVNVAVARVGVGSSDNYQIAQGEDAVLRVRIAIFNMDALVDCGTFNQDLYVRYFVNPAGRGRFRASTPGGDFGAATVSVVGAMASSASVIEEPGQGILHFPAGSCALDVSIPTYRNGTGVSTRFSFELVGFAAGPNGLAHLMGPGPAYSILDRGFEIAYLLASTDQQESLRVFLTGLSPQESAGDYSSVAASGGQTSVRVVRIGSIGDIDGILTVGDSPQLGVEPESGVSELRFPVSFSGGGASVDMGLPALPGFFLYRVQGTAVVDLPDVNGVRPADPDIRLPAGSLARRVSAADRAQAGFPQDVPVGAVIAEFNIPAGEETGAIVMEVLADDLAEPAETVELSVLDFRVGPRPYLPGDGKTSAAGRIGGNDPVEIAVAAPAADTAEGNSILFPLRLGGGRFDGSLRVVYSVAGTSGNPATGPDYNNNVLNGDFRIRQEPNGRYSALDAAGMAVPSLQNQVSLAIPILALLDSVTEAAGEELTLTLGSVTPLAADGTAAELPVSIGTASAAATIVDGVAITVAINGGVDGSATVSEGQTADIPVSLSGAFTSPATLVCEFSDVDMAQPREDYELGRVLSEDFRRGETTFEAECGTIEAGAASASIRIPLLREAVLETGFDAAEGDEDFTVFLIDLLGAVGDVDTSRSAPAYTITIADQPANRVALSAERTEIMEGQSLSFTVALSGTATTESVSVPISLAGIPADQLTVTGVPAAFGLNNYMLTLAAGSGGASVTGSFNVTVTDNASVEAMRSLQVVLGAPSGGGGMTAREFVLVGSPRSVSVVDNDGVVVTLTPATRAGVDASEGGNASFAVQAAQAPATDVTVSYSLGADGDTAVRGVDYMGGVGGSVILAAGATAVNIDIPVTDDDRPEGVERFSLRLTGVAGDAQASLGIAAELGAEAAIARSDPVSVAVTAAPATVMEGQAVSFDIALSAGGSPVALDQTLVLNYSLPATGTAVPNLPNMVGDYVPPLGYAGGAMRAGMTAVAAGRDRASLDVTTIQDGAMEGAETIVLQADSVESLGGNPVDSATGIEFLFGAGASATATIEASMTTASLGLADVQFAVARPSAASAAEGESVTFALRRSGSLPASLTFADYAMAANMPRVSLGYSISGVAAADIASIAVAGGSFAQNAQTVSADADLTGRTLQINVAAAANYLRKASWRLCQWTSTLAGSFLSG